MKRMPFSRSQLKMEHVWHAGCPQLWPQVHHAFAALYCAVVPMLLCREAVMYMQTVSCSRQAINHQLACMKQA